MGSNGNKSPPWKASQCQNVAMPVPAIEMATTFHAFIYHQIQMREALTTDNRNENEKQLVRWLKLKIKGQEQNQPLVS